MSTENINNIAYVANMEDARPYSLDGAPVLARTIIADFLGCEASAVDERSETFRIVGSGPLANFDRVMRQGETIMVYAAAVAEGGVKGAVQS